MTPFDVLDAAERLLAKVATEVHKDAAVAVQFMAGEWSAFKNVIERARAVAGPSPQPEPPPPPEPVTPPTSPAPTMEDHQAALAKIAELEKELALAKTPTVATTQTASTPGGPSS